MTISVIKPGGWAVGEKLRSTEVNSVQTELLKCVDGENGGTYTPTDPIVIGGEGAEFTTDLVVNRVHVDGGYIKYDVTLDVGASQTISWNGYGAYVVALESLTGNRTWTLGDDGSAPIGVSITFHNPCTDYYVDVVYNGYGGTNTSRIQKANSKRASVTLTKVDDNIWIPTAGFSYQSDGS
jgi:hypothetical protein